MTEDMTATSEEVVDTGTDTETPEVESQTAEQVDMAH